MAKLAYPVQELSRQCQLKYKTIIGPYGTIYEPFYTRFEEVNIKNIMIYNRSLDLKITSSYLKTVTINYRCFMTHPI